MKKYLIGIGAAVVLATTLVILWNLYAMPTVTFAFAVPKTIGDKLPLCIPSQADCRWKIHKLQRQQASTSAVTWDVYATYRGRQYHAHVQRIGTHSTHWGWVISGEEYWLKMVRKYKALNPTHVTHGPALMVNVPNNATLCDLLASHIFIDVTDDGGGPRPANIKRHSCAPASDGGVAGDCTMTQPDLGVLANCGGKWWVPRSRYGGPDPRTQAESDSGFLVDIAASGGSNVTVTPGVDPNSWVAPDARTQHQCTLPIGTPCP